ncbi:hypothetical protein U1Q18_026906 [Sarracenia purpurea var. burkii]
MDGNDADARLRQQDCSWRSSAMALVVWATEAAATSENGGGADLVARRGATEGGGVDLVAQVNDSGDSWSFEEIEDDECQFAAAQSRFVGEALLVSWDNSLTIALSHSFMEQSILYISLDFTVQEKKVKKISETNIDLSKAVGNGGVFSSSVSSSSRSYLANGGYPDRSCNYLSNDFSFPPEGIPSLRLPVVLVIN